MTSSTPASPTTLVPRKRSAWTRILRHWQWYLVLLIPFVYVIIFKYIPMFGITIAFRDFDGGNMFEAPFVGFKHFITFFNSNVFTRVLRNTVTISLYNLIAGFPLPIIMALALNNCNVFWYKKTVQMITYAPYFISTVVMVSIISQILHMRYGLVNRFVTQMGGTAVNFMGEEGLFKSIYVWTGVWQYTGYNSIMYIAVLSGVDPTLHEAAVVDGASLWQRVVNIDLVAIIPTATIMLILSAGNMLNVGFEKVFLMSNSMNIDSSDIIATYVYRMGLERQQFSLATAVGLFNSVINMILLTLVNFIAGKVGETSLW